MKTLLLAAAFLLPATAAVAQTPPTGPGPNHAEFEARMKAHMERHRQEEVTDLSTVLGLKPAQLPALQAWLEAQHPPMGGHYPEGTPPDAPKPPMTTPDRLAKDQSRLAEMQQFESAKIAATQRFYASLDTHQKAVFDALDRLRHDHHGGGEHHGHGGPGGPDHGPDMPPPGPPPAQ